jgi:hypothetical protein
MDNSPSSIVLLGGNRNRVGSMSRGRCCCSGLVNMTARVEASVSKMTLLSTSKTPPFSLQRVLSKLGPLDIPISSIRDLEIVGVLNHLTLQGRESLSS